MAEWRCMCRSSGETMNHLLHATLHMKCGPLYSLCLKFIRFYGISFCNLEEKKLFFMRFSGDGMGGRGHF